MGVWDLSLRREPMDLVQAQIEREKAFHQNQLMNRIKQSALDAGLDKTLEAKGLNAERGVAIVVRLLAQKKAHPSVLAGILKGLYASEEEPYKEMIKDLHGLWSNGFIGYDPTVDMFYTKAELSAEAWKEIDLFGFMPPFVAPPKHLHEKNHNPFYTNIPRDNRLNNTDKFRGDTSYDVLNILNHQEMVINYEVSEMVALKWKSLTEIKPDDEDFDKWVKKREQYEKYEKATQDHLAGLSFFSTIFMVWAVDGRGRLYTEGYHVNPQGADWNKASIDLALSLPITENIEL